mgnify:CR=1 FL=1
MSTRTGYIVLSDAFEYNDNYYVETEDGKVVDKFVYFDKAKAEARAKELNTEHARRVLGNVWAWTYGEGFSLLISEASREEVETLLSKVVISEGADGKRADLQHAASLTLKNDEDLSWFIDTFSYVQIARVLKVEVPEGAG